MGVIDHVEPDAREATVDHINRMQGIHRQIAIAYKRSNPSTCSLGLLQPCGSLRYGRRWARAFATL